MGVGAVRNATAVGRAIDCDHREPPDDLSRPFRLLRYPPIAVWVEPVEAPVPLGASCGPRAPVNCMPVTVARQSGAVKFPKGAKIHGLDKWTGTRVAFPLGDGFCVTDYYAQGQSFGDSLWFAHLSKPDRGALVRASVLVTLTRFRDWEAARPWTRLWPPGNAAMREKVITAFHNVARPSDDLRSDMHRLSLAERRTISALPAHLRALLNN